MTLYHYRSAEAAIAEISKQTLQFSKSELLNDPIEGYLSFYWEGDRPAWEGLFRNYIVSLHHVITDCMLKNEEGIEDNAVEVDIHRFEKDNWMNPLESPPPIAGVVKVLGDELLADKDIQDLISFLCDNQIKCGKEEVIIILFAIHEIALEICEKEMLKSGIHMYKDSANPGTHPKYMNTRDVIRKFLAGADALSKDHEGSDNQEARTLKDLQRLVSALSQLFGDAISSQEVRFYNRVGYLKLVEESKSNVYPHSLADLVPEKFRTSVVASKVRNSHSYEDYIKSRELEEGFKFSKLDLTKRKKLFDEFEEYISSEVVKQLVEAGKYKTPDDKEKINAALMENIMRVRLEFPRIYINQLLKILTPTYYITCFSECNTNSSMWGTYADSHRGACLIYNVPDEGLRLGIDESGDDQGSITLRPEKVNYDGAVQRRNFFNWLWTFPKPIADVWLTGSDGKRSRYFHITDKAREEYWNTYKLIFTQKTSDWKLEKEHRLMFSDVLSRFGGNGRIYLRYEPKALTGIVFGINTTALDRVRIINAVKETRGNLNGVDFFQAEFDDIDQKIKIRKKLMTIE